MCQNRYCQMILLGLGLLLSGNLMAEVMLKAQARLISEPNRGVSFIIEGHTSLPDNVILVLSLHFNGERIPWSWQTTRVKKGRFYHQHGPLKARVLSGAYILKVAYHRFRQFRSIKPQLLTITDFERTFHFYVGQAAQELKEEQQFAGRIDALRNDFTKLFDQLLKIEEQIKPLPSKEQATMALSWWRKWPQEHAAANQALAKLQYPYVLVPYFPQSVHDLTAISFCLQALFQYKAEQLGARFHFNVPHERILVEHPALSLQPAEYIAEIRRRLRSIARRSNRLQEINENVLYLDLGRINQFYMQLHQNFGQAALKQISRDYWRSWLQSWYQGLETLNARISLYPGTALANRHPRLTVQLEHMMAILKQLAAYYAKVLQQELAASDATQEGRLVADLQNAYLNIYKVVVQEKERHHQQRRQASQRLQDLLRELLQLYQQLERVWSHGQTDPQKWHQWYPQWQKQLRTRQAQFKDYENTPLLFYYYPHSGHYLRTAAFCLQGLARLYSERIQGHHRSTFEERQQYFKTTWQRVCAHIQRQVPTPQHPTATPK